MPLGYVVNKRYIIDKRYDRYAALPVFDRLTAEAQKRGYGLHINVSAMTRGYLCEVRTYEKPSKNSAHTYFHTVGHKYASNPLAAAVAAMQQCVPPDPLLLVLYLEAEAVQLGIEIADRRAVESKLEAALDALFEVVALGWGYLTRQQAIEGTWTIEGKNYPGKLWFTDQSDRFDNKDEMIDLVKPRAKATFTIDEVNPDNLAAAFGVRKPDLDDDL